MPLCASNRSSTLCNTVRTRENDGVPTVGDCSAAPEHLRFFLIPVTAQRVYEAGGSQRKVYQLQVAKPPVELWSNLEHLELPNIGDRIVRDMPFGAVESETQVAPLFAPVSGKVLERYESVSSSRDNARRSLPGITLLKVIADDESTLQLDEGSANTASWGYWPSASKFVGTATGHSDDSPPFKEITFHLHRIASKRRDIGARVRENLKEIQMSNVQTTQSDKKDTLIICLEWAVFWTNKVIAKIEIREFACDLFVLLSVVMNCARKEVADPEKIRWLIKCLRYDESARIQYENSVAEHERAVHLFNTRPFRERIRGHALELMQTQSLGRASELFAIAVGIGGLLGCGVLCYFGSFMLGMLYLAALIPAVLIVTFVSKADSVCGNRLAPPIEPHIPCTTVRWDQRITSVRIAEQGFEDAYRLASCVEACLRSALLEAGVAATDMREIDDECEPL